MKRMKKPALTKQAWLHELGRRLAWSFPISQAKDILSDYQEQFEAGHDHCKTEAEIIQGLGTPAEAAALLLEEEPTAKTNRLRHNFIWGAALVVCFAFLWLCMNTGGLLWFGTVVFLLSAAAVMFLLLRGPARVRLEHDFPPERTPSPVLSYGVPFVLALLSVGTELGLLLLAKAGWLPDVSPSYLGELNTWFILAVEAVLAALAAWLLVQSVTGSIRYLPGLVHTVGAMATAFFTYAILCSSLAVDRAFITELLPCFLPCIAGLAAALAAQGWVDGRKPLPRIFQGGAVTWQDWRHRLGVSLLGWFSVEQALEVLEDYQEQYELGREQGKAEESLLNEMGRPETVVRDLLAEDRKARLRRQKTWVWVVLAGISGWLLLGMLRSFEFGYAGFGWFYGEHAVRVCILAVVLGSVSLFFLFHAHERAAVERWFPAPQKPIAWVYLLPLLATALVEWLTLWAVRDSLDYRTPVFLGAPLTMFIILSIEFSVLLLTLLLIWTLARCVSGSIRHLAAVPCIAGSFAQITCTGIILSGMDMESSIRSGAIKAVLTTLLPFAAGAALAMVCWLVLRFSEKKEG